MFNSGTVRRLTAALGFVLAFAWSASAQITTGTVTGTVTDAQGVVPGATVMLVSQAQGTKLGPQVTDKDGNFTFAYVAADLYTVTVEMSGYKGLERKDVKVSGGDKIAVPTLMLVPGG